MPRPYQPPAIAHLLNNPRCALWAGMGLGKCVTTLTALDALFMSGTETRPALVLAPLRVAANTWPTEVEKWSHFSHIEMSAVVGTEKERIIALKRDASVYTINYENLPWLCTLYGTDWPFGTVVADEATRTKNLRVTLQTSTKGTQFYRADGGVRMRAIGKIAHTKINRWINLTGTPAPNGLRDLWGQTWLIDQGVRLGRTYQGFMTRWFQRTHGEYGVEPLPHAQTEIQDRLKDVCMSINAKDYFDIADPIVTDIRVELPEKSRKLYRDMAKRMYMEIEGNPIEAFNAASRTIKCLQIASGAAFTDDSAGANRPWVEVHDVKLQALESIIEEAAGMPVLVAYWFKPTLARLKKAFKQGRELDRKKETEDAWNAGKIPLLFVQWASASHGLNLQDGGNIIVYIDQWWDMELYQQILERIGPVRQFQAGHNRPVFVYRIIASRTVDEDVIERHETKAAVQDILLKATNRERAA